MRLLARLQCAEDGRYEMQYHYHLQGFIYNLLRGSKYHHIHNKEGYKFFCFSNIFPTRDLVKGDLRTLIISSPDSEFVACLHEALQKWNSGGNVAIGAMKFKVDYVEKFEIKIPNTPFTLITGTPIVMRIPREKYKAYGVEPKGKYSYVYWRRDHPIDLFIQQLENNLAKKHVEYLGFDSSQVFKQNSFSLRFFEKLRFKKQISTRVLMKGFDQIVIGTICEFEFRSAINTDMVRFALDSGLGERNSLGFGFINLQPLDENS